MGQKITILDADAIAAKLTRLAYEVVEHHVGETAIIIAGICDNGFIIAKDLQQRISAICDMQISTVSVALDKKNPGAITISPSVDVENQVVLLVDDVSMTGKTILYALQPFLPGRPKKIQTLVLVERQLKNFPIHSDYVGLHISTTMQELIMVEQENGILKSAYLI